MSETDFLEPGDSPLKALVVPTGETAYIIGGLDGLSVNEQFDGEQRKLLHSAAQLLRFYYRKVELYCDVCWTSSGIPVKDEKDCRLVHPHEGEHETCGYCAAHDAIVKYLSEWEQAEKKAIGARNEGRREALEWVVDLLSKMRHASDGSDQLPLRIAMAAFFETIKSSIEIQLNALKETPNDKPEDARPE